MGIVPIHRIDADDVITYLDDGFRRQAEEAGVPNLPAQTLGDNLFHFMAGEPTRTWYHWLLVRVRQLGPIRFPFRCDTRFYVESLRW
ncbi:hypothetical protein [Nitrospira sp. Nam74]